jgi:hypothetical protein
MWTSWSRKMVQAAAGAPRVLDVDQLVGGDREAQPGAGLLAVVEPDALVVAVAENLGGERAAGRDVVGEQVDVVEALDGRAARRVTLRLVAQRWLEVVGRDIALGLPQHLHDVAVGVVEAVGGPVAVVAVVPSDVVAARLDRGHLPLERLGAVGAPRHVGEAGAVGLRELERVALVLAPPAQEDRLAGARLDLHAEHVVEVGEAPLRLRGEELDVVDVGEVAHSTRARRLSRS